MAQQNYGSKRVVVGAHYGLRDWLSQRITAALMALFTIVLLLQAAKWATTAGRGSSPRSG
jgi:succinate dehydrogenase hydrophobic anchor subunit